jgi:hypothetical protein
MKLIAVNWLDIVTSHGWEGITETGDTAAPHEVQSIGIKVAESENSITLAATYSQDGAAKNAETNCRITIPKCCIQSTHELVLVEEQSQQE